MPIEFKPEGESWVLEHSVPGVNVFITFNLDSESWSVTARGPIPDNYQVMGDLNIYRDKLDYATALALAEYVISQLEPRHD